MRPPIQVWTQLEDVPEELRSYLTPRSYIDYIVLVPKDYPDTPYWLRFGNFNACSLYPLPDGSVLRLHYRAP